MNISLPDFSVTLVSRLDDGSFDVSETTLKQRISERQLGLVLYFYPKDNTQGCTVQAVDFSADIQAYYNKGYQVIGVSRDSVKSHQNFINKQNLNIPLISDTDEALCQHFDVIKEKMMYGKTHLGVVRSSFVFDKSGTLIHELRNVKAKGHSQALLELLSTQS